MWEWDRLNSYNSRVVDDHPAFNSDSWLNMWVRPSLWLEDDPRISLRWLSPHKLFTANDVSYPSASGLAHYSYMYMYVFMSHYRVYATFQLYFDLYICALNMRTMPSNIICSSVCMSHEVVIFQLFPTITWPLRLKIKTNCANT